MVFLNARERGDHRRGKHGRELREGKEHQGIRPDVEAELALSEPGSDEDVVQRARPIVDGVEREQVQAHREERAGGPPGRRTRSPASGGEEESRRGARSEDARRDQRPDAAAGERQPQRHDRGNRRGAQIDHGERAEAHAADEQGARDDGERPEQDGCRARTRDVGQGRDAVEPGDPRSGDEEDGGEHRADACGDDERSVEVLGLELLSLHERDAEAAVDEQAQERRCGRDHADEAERLRRDHPGEGD